MNTNVKIAFIGAGNLPEAIIFALVNKLNISGQNITIFDKNEEQYKRYDALKVKKASIYTALYI